MAPTKGCQLRQEKHKVLNNTLVRKIIICSLKTQLVMTTVTVSTYFIIKAVTDFIKILISEFVSEYRVAEINITNKTQQRCNIKSDK